MYAEVWEIFIKGKRRYNPHCKAGENWALLLASYSRHEHWKSYELKRSIISLRKTKTHYVSVSSGIY